MMAQEILFMEKLFIEMNLELKRVCFGVKMDKSLLSIEWINQWLQTIL